jgi:hypothetical protein
LYGLSDARCDILEGQKRDEALAKTREKRWSLYVARAVERFEAWWLKVLVPMEGGERLMGKNMLATNGAFMSFPESGRPQNWNCKYVATLG